ncbi:MAG: dihydrofolate reductase family protein [Saprospiraceae bacterium]
MKKIIVSLHTSLDGFVGGPNGEMDWIRFDEAMFDLVKIMTDHADTALYGRVTYQMMDSYWPGAGDNPGASKHDIEHSQWYNTVNKIVLSRTLQNPDLYKTTFVGEDIMDNIANQKLEKGKNILIFGSPSAVHTLMEHGLIDEYWLFINPVVLGRGIPLFSNISGKKDLKLKATKTFECGVVGLHYEVLK